MAICALTTRQPSGKRTQLCVCRPGAGAQTRWNSALAVAKSVPKLVMTVFSRLRGGDPPTRAVRNDWIAVISEIFRPGRIRTVNSDGQKRASSTFMSTENQLDRDSG